MIYLFRRFQNGVHCRHTKRLINRPIDGSAQKRNNISERARCRLATVGKKVLARQKHCQSCGFFSAHAEASDTVRVQDIHQTSRYSHKVALSRTLHHSLLSSEEHSESQVGRKVVPGKQVGNELCE